VNEDFVGRPFLADSHAYPVPDEAFRLLDYVLDRHTPSAIVLERDDRLDAGDEILDDVARIRAHVARAKFRRAPHVESTLGQTGQAA
jgi:uncharacterized protein (UPF0276 family)